MVISNSDTGSGMNSNCVASPATILLFPEHCVLQVAGGGTAFKKKDGGEMLEIVVQWTSVFGGMRKKEKKSSEIF